LRPIVRRGRRVVQAQYVFIEPPPALQVETQAWINLGNYYRKLEIKARIDNLEPLRLKIYLIEAISKNGFWFKVKAAANIKPEEYIGYFEDLI